MFYSSMITIHNCKILQQLAVSPKMLLNKIPTPFRARWASLIYRMGLTAGTIAALVTGYLAVQYDEIGQFTGDPGYLLGYAFAIFFLIAGSCFIAAILVEAISGRLQRAYETPNKKKRLREPAPQKWLVLTRIVAGLGVVVGGTVAFLAGDAAMWHNPQLMISDDPVYFTLIILSWFFVFGGPILLLAGAIEVI